MLKRFILFFRQCWPVKKPDQQLPLLYQRLQDMQFLTDEYALKVSLLSQELAKARGARCLSEKQMLVRFRKWAKNRRAHRKQARARSRAARRSGR